MKIRSDFVTNSSSSCFCVRLILDYDSGDSFDFYGFRGEGDERYNSCINRENSNTISDMTHLGSSFSMIAQASEDKDLDALRKVLNEELGIQDPEIPEDAEEIADAQMIIKACVSGDYSDEAGIFQMFGALISDQGESDGDAVNKLRESGLNRFTQEGLEMILDSQGDKGSKRYLLYLTDTNEVEVDYEQEEYFKPTAPKRNKVSKLQSFTYEQIALFTDQFNEMKKAVIKWAEKGGYDLSLDEEDDEETFFSKLGIAEFIEVSDEDIILCGSDLDISDLCFPVLDLLKVLAPYVDFVDVAYGRTKDREVEINVEDGKLIVS